MKMALKAFVRPHVRNGKNGERIQVSGYTNAKPAAKLTLPKREGPWVGVDLDKTLAYHRPGDGLGEIGHPIPAMMRRVRDWLKAGKRVKIFTARASEPGQVKVVQAWLEKHGLPKLEVTNVKDPDCEQIWDDKAVGVEPNQGTRKLVLKTHVRGYVKQDGTVVGPCQDSRRTPFKSLLKSILRRDARFITHDELRAAAESADIKKNRQTPEAQQPHDFHPAQYTHKNGHPRCLLCGDDEPASGRCPGVRMQKSLRLTLKSFPIAYRMTYQSIPLAIEQPKGSVRYWTDDATGEKGQTVMQCPYGYIPGTKGMDTDLGGKKEGIDVFVGPAKDAPMVYIVTQMKRPDFVVVDEQKIMLGFTSAEEAKAAYMTHFNDPRFFGVMRSMPIEEFKWAIRDRMKVEWPIWGGEPEG